MKANTDMRYESRLDFEAFAKMRDWDISRSQHIPERYANERTQGAWVAWCHGVQTWQPIETCPRDGTEFLAFKATEVLGGIICVCTWLDSDHPNCDGETPHVAWDHSGFWDATHWMPLPGNPAPKGMGHEPR